MTTDADLSSAITAKTSNPPRFPAAYGAWLEKQAQSIGLDRNQIAKLADLDYQTVYRNFTGKPQRSVLAANKIRRVLLERGLEIPPVPGGEEEWSPPEIGAVGHHGTANVGIADPLRRNLVNFREQANLLLHEAAEATGIPLEKLRAYENGDQLVSGPHLLELARVYGRPAEQFDMPEPPPPDGKRAPAIYFRVVGSLDDMSPEDRDRLIELRRELEAINARERARIAQAKAAAKRTSKPKKP